MNVKKTSWYIMSVEIWADNMERVKGCLDFISIAVSVINGFK